MGKPITLDQWVNHLERLQEMQTKPARFYCTEHNLTFDWNGSLPPPCPKCMAEGRPSNRWAQRRKQGE